MSQDALFAHEALILRLRLEFGLVGLEEIELWADAWLMELEKSPDALTDLALAQRAGASDAFALLKQLNPVDSKPKDILAAAAHANTVQLSAGQIRELVSRIEAHAIPVEYTTADDEAGSLLMEAISLSDAFDLAKSGQYGSVEEACERARRYFDDARKLTTAAKAVA